MKRKVKRSEMKNNSEFQKNVSYTSDKHINNNIHNKKKLEKMK